MTKPNDPPSEAVRVTRALISVSDKTGLVPFARALVAHGVEILSTGGSARALSEAGLTVTEVSAHTGFPEIMGGRVKTLHPLIHGGILGRRDDAGDRAAMAEHGIAPIDLVAVNLYPFERTAAAGADFATCIETIDIGGPTLIRAAAKNHAHVVVLTEAADYDLVTAEMAAHDGAVGAALRRRLAASAFAHTGAYDAAIATWFADGLGEPFPERLVLAGRRRELLRYGENPHQAAAFYVSGDGRPGVATAEQIQGKALSYNNLNDTDAAFELVAEFARPTVAIIKHANPCGVATDETLAAAHARALATDPTSAFGGIVAVNHPLDGATAAAIAEVFTEVVIAPDADDEARAILAGKKNLRLLVTGAMPDPRAGGRIIRSLAGGFLAQSRDDLGGEAEGADAALTVVSKRPPDARERADMLFAFTVAKHVKSNAIVYAKNGATAGIGAGQMSRVDSARIAAVKARDAAEKAGLSESPTVGSVVASDAFFPFADGMIAAAEAGATAVIQPGGSVRDDEVIAAADARGLAMVFTGHRHFRH